MYGMSVCSNPSKAPLSQAPLGICSSGVGQVYYDELIGHTVFSPLYTAGHWTDQFSSDGTSLPVFATYDRCKGLNFGCGDTTPILAGF